MGLHHNPECWQTQNTTYIKFNIYNEDLQKVTNSLANIPRLRVKNLGVMDVAFSP